MTRFALPLLAALALLFAGCGGDDAGEDPTKLLDRGLATDVDSGEISMEVEVEVEGVEGADGPFRLELSGPFRSRGPTQLPDVDLDFSASGAGAAFEGRVVTLPENAWIEYGGETYEVGEDPWRSLRDSLATDTPRSFADANVDPLDWVEDAETGDTKEISGTDTTQVTGEVDVAAMLRDFNRLNPESATIPRRVIDQIDDAIETFEFEAWIGEDDIWRRLSSETRFTVPEDQREEAGGLEGGRVSVDMTLDAPNEPVTIESPGKGRPLSELLRSLGIPPEAVLGPGVEVPEPG